MIPAGHKMATIDFESMYTNIPVDRAMAVISKLWDDVWTHPDLVSVPRVSIEVAEHLIRFYISEGGFFLPDGIMYKQNKGLMMGASLNHRHLIAVVVFLLKNSGK